MAAASNSSNNGSNSPRRILIVDDEPDIASAFDMILEMNGFELYKKIKDIDNKIEACFITAFEDYREEFKESFPELEEAKYFIRKPKAIEDLVKHVAAILG
jgi:two-component SAPR family response regulator